MLLPTDAPVCWVWALQRLQKAKESLIHCNCGGFFFVCLVFGGFFGALWGTNCLLIGNVPVIWNNKGLCSASRWAKQSYFALWLKKKKRGRGDGITQSIPIAFEYLNNVFYTHFFLGTIGWLWEVISAIRMYTNNIPVLLRDYVFAEHIHLIRYDF